jgi:multiple antibiotic resistance protein
MAGKSTVIALATILLEVGEVNAKPLVFAMVLIVCWVLMLATPRLMKVLGVTGANVTSRLSSVILAALAVQFIIDGLRGSFL